MGMNDNMKGPIPTGTASAEGPVDSAETFGQDAGTSGTVYNAARDPNAAANAASSFEAKLAALGVGSDSNKKLNSKTDIYDDNGNDDDYVPIDDGDYDDNNAPIAMMKDEYPGNFVQ